MSDFQIGQFENTAGQVGQIGSAEGISSAAAAQQVMVVQLASKLHDLWREPRRLSDQDRSEKGVEFDPRVKEVNGQQYDIANLGYVDLPEKFQSENRAAAEGALDELARTIGNFEEANTTQFIDKLSDTIHEQWMERNGAWADAALMVPYTQLPEEEKEKDRVIARAAIEVYSAKMSN